MKITQPLTITSRLLPGICIDGVRLSVDYACEKQPDSTQYVFYVDYNGKEFCCTGATPSDAGLQKGLELLLDYLGVFEVAVQYCRETAAMSEDFKLFPEELADWAVKNSMEIYDLQCRLITETLIEE